MNFNNYLNILSKAFGRGVFPYQMSWILDLPGRGLIMSAQTLANRLPVSSSATVLEIGPGSGYYSVEVAKKILHGTLYILDIQKEMLDKCKQKLDLAGLKNYETHLGDGKTLPFEDHIFDAIYMVTVFGEIENRQDFLMEAARVLKPKGVLSITEHHPDPDFETSTNLQNSVESYGFTLGQKLGWKWAYTLNFFNR
jgi:ubiquinone/menaquinone biosynthesis C-methylase UbiE